MLIIKIDKFIKKMCVLFILLLLNLGETSVDKEMIVDKISSYFTKIFSIQCEGNIEMNLTSIGKKISSIPILSQNLKYKFISNGNKFRCEVSFFDPFIKKYTQKILCWDGEKYQILEIGEKRILSLSKYLPDGNVYFIPNPLLFPFAFLFKKGQNFSLNTFQNQAYIKDCLKNISEIEESQRVEHKGVYITLKKEGLSNNTIEIYKIFLSSDLNFFPLFFQTLLSEDFTEETEVKEYFKIEGIIIPTIIYSSVYKKGELLQRVKVTINKETLKLNIPIETEFFSIPFSHADKVWDGDSRIWIK